MRGNLQLTAESDVLDRDDAADSRSGPLCSKSSHDPDTGFLRAQRARIKLEVRARGKFLMALGFS